MRFILEQQTGDMVATGNVTSTRMPDAKQSSDGLLKGGEPVQAKAQRMASTERSTKIRYEGDALLWQAGQPLAGQDHLHRQDRADAGMQRAM